jgi:hypothetical protein
MTVARHHGRAVEFDDQDSTAAYRSSSSCSAAGNFWMYSAA